MRLRLPACLTFALLAGFPFPTASAQTAAPAPPGDTPTPAVTQPDSALLLKAFQAISAAPALSSESDLDLKAVKGGAAVTIHEHLKLLARKSNRFRSEITVGTPGAGSLTKYEVVSDGSRVMTSQPGARQYSVATLAAFKAADDDLPALAILGGQLYLGAFAADMVSVSKATGGPFAKTVAAMGMSLTGAARNVNGAELTVFTLTIPKTGKYVFSVDPQTDALKQVELKGSDGGATFDLVETISASAPAVAPPASFRLTVPAGLHKAKHVSIGSY